MVSITDILIYPVKGCGGVSVKRWPIEGRGLQFDRQWMLVDGHGKFVSQREYPQMAFFRMHWTGAFFEVEFDGSGQRMPLPIPELGSAQIAVNIWDQEVMAAHLPGACEDYFNLHLGQGNRLVYMPDHAFRRVDEKYSPDAHYTRFTDGYPVLILGTASMEHLNKKLAMPLPIDRFRPNLVLSTDVAHEEDQWRNLDHTCFKLDLVKPCSRCVVTTIDQRTGTKGKEPLATLASYRTFDKKVNFGMNAVVASAEPLSFIEVGDTLHTK